VIFFTIINREYGASRLPVYQKLIHFRRSSWLWSYGSWIHNYLCNQCLSPLKLWIRIPLMAMCSRYNIMW